MLNYIFSIMPSLFSGAWLTTEIFFWTTVVSIPLGLLVAFGLHSKLKLVKANLWRTLYESELLPYPYLS